MKAVSLPRIALLLPLVVLLNSGAFADQVSLNGHNFTLPDGFEIQLIAAPPLVDRPITAAFDEAGRLYVAESSGSNDPVQKQLAERPHRILRLEDTNGDGRFDTRTVFADQMMFPEGTMWYDGSLYVAAPPSIWRLTDVDGDGIADERSEWFQGKTLTGCANDLHGPYLGPDGWIYWCKGAFAQQQHEVHGQLWKTRAAHIFRCRPDGTGLEPVMTGGMDNPVDVVFTPGGERIFTTTFLVHPSAGQRDGLLHAVHGGVYGKEHGVLEGHPRTGPLMPVLSHMGSAAPCGLARYTSRAWGAEFQDNLFACQFNLRKVSRHVLTPLGATFQSRDSDFLVSDHLDFHPTDVLEDADGSLIVIDTGGWYKLCCPTSQLYKPDVLGGIYRVRRRNVPAVADPRGRRIAWDSAAVSQLVELLDDERPVVRRRAAQRLVRSTDVGAVPALLAKLKADVPASLRCEVIWALTRIDSRAARAAVRQGLADPDETVRQAALHSVSLWRDREASAQLIELLASSSPHNRRAAAEALGRIGRKTAVPHLLAAARRAEDRFLEHSVVYALVELGDGEQTALGLESDDAQTQRVALVALDQMPGTNLDVEQVRPLLNSERPELRETAHWLVAHHPEWGGALAEWLGQQLAELGDEDQDRAVPLQAQLVQLAAHTAVQKLLADCADRKDLSPLARRIVLRGMADSRPKALPDVWAESLARVISSDDEQTMQAALATTRSLPAPEEVHPGLRQSLLNLAHNQALSGAVRVQALAAIPAGLMDVSEETFKLLVAHVAASEPIETRSAAADAIGQSQLSDDQLEQLIPVIAAVGPLELHRLLAPFQYSANDELALKLIEALKQSASLSSLRVDELRQRLSKRGPAVQEAIDELYALGNVDVATQRRRIEELLPSVAAGDVRRGQAVFNSSKAACIACHRFGYVGGNAGPDLTRIGQTRTERDLLEAIVYPSLSFVRSYEPVILIAADGRVLSGLVRNETDEEITLTTGINQEVSVRRDLIDELRPGTVSVMPSGLDQQLTEQELADLVAFLKNAK